MVTAGIVTAEIAFWVVLLGGLACRYPLRLRRVSAVLLFSLPLIDLALLALVVVDLQQGAVPSGTHAFAGVYLGSTVAFGHPVVRWADARFAHRFRDAPLPVKAARGSRREVRELWREWARVAVATGIACSVLAWLSVLTGAPPLPPSPEAAATDPFWAQMAMMALVTVIWFLAGPAFARARVPDGTPSHR